MGKIEGKDIASGYEVKFRHEAVGSGNRGCKVQATGDNITAVDPIRDISKEEGWD